MQMAFMVCDHCEKYVRITSTSHTCGCLRVKKLVHKSYAFINWVSETGKVQESKSKSQASMNTTLISTTTNSSLWECENTIRFCSIHADPFSWNHYLHPCRHFFLVFLRGFCHWICRLFRPPLRLQMSKATKRETFSGLWEDVGSKTFLQQSGVKSELQWPSSVSVLCGRLVLKR